MLTGLYICTFGITWLLAFVPRLVIQKAQGVTYRFKNWVGFRKTILWYSKQWSKGRSWDECFGCFISYSFYRYV